MAYTFEQIEARDPSNPELIAANALVTIFAPGDPTQTPLEITTTQGWPLSNPIQVNGMGYGPAFMHPSLDRVAWSGGEFTGFFTSYDSIKQDAVAAAESAEVSRIAAEQAARNSLAPAAEVVAAVLATQGPAQDAINAAISAGTANLAEKPDNGGRPVGKGELVINAKDYGAVGDGITDDTASLQAAADAAASIPEAILFMPPGTFKTSATLIVVSAMDAGSATISYNGSGVALQIGSTPVTSRRTYHLPRVVKAGATGFDGTSCGVRAMNLNSCLIYVPFIQHFEHGLRLEGIGAGCVHNTIFPGSLWSNHKNLVYTADSTGWTNSNTVVGGRFAYGPAWGTVNDRDAAQIYMVGSNEGIAGPNSNTFIGSSLEASDVMYYRAVIGGRYNNFINCRWEGLSGSTPRILSVAGADYNVVDGGYDVFKIEDVVEGGGRPPAIVNAGAIQFRANAVTAKTLTATGADQEALIDTWTSLGGGKYSYSNGVFTPRAGLWDIKVTVAVSGPSSAGFRQLALKKAGTVMDVDRKAGAVGILSLKAGMVERFNGTESFSAHISQNAPSGSDCTLATTNRFCRVEATYLGAN